MYVNVELVNTWKSRRRIQDICGQAHDRAISFLALLDTNDLFRLQEQVSLKDIALIYISKSSSISFRPIFTSILSIREVDTCARMTWMMFEDFLFYIPGEWHIIDHSFHDMEKV